MLFTTDRGTIVIRIIELPAVRMARSGHYDLEAFSVWWSAIKVPAAGDLCPRDFMWFNPALQADEWLYVLPDGMVDSGGFDVFDFPGGVYAVATCADDISQPDNVTAVDMLIHQWIAQSDVFDEEPNHDPAKLRYDMAHVITPKSAQQAMSYAQMDLFVPIVLRM